MTLPGAPEKEPSQSWVLFKRFYRQVSSEINAGTGHEQSAQGTEEEPQSCLGNQGKVHGEPGQCPSDLPLAMEVGTGSPKSQHCLSGWCLFLAALMSGRKKYLKYTTL